MNAKPSKIKALKGTLRKGRTNPTEPQPAPGIPEPPEWMEPEAAAEFRRVARLLEPLAYLTEQDRGVLAAYALAWGEIVLAGQGKKPLTAAMLTSFRQLAACLGLDPTNRGRISVPAKPKANPFADMRGKR